jgi:hypothetical protein
MAESQTLPATESNTNYKASFVIGLRFVQLITVCMVIVGFIWGSSDFLLASVLKDSPVTPLSVLLMLYGGLGLGITESVIRIVQRKK